MGLGTEIRDVCILGGLVLCGGLGTDIGDVNGGGQRPGSFGLWDRYWGFCMIIVNTVGVGVGGQGQKFGCEYFGEVMDRDWGYQYFRGVGACDRDWGC